MRALFFGGKKWKHGVTFGRKVIAPPSVNTLLMATPMDISQIGGNKF